MLFDDERATKAVLSFLRKTKVGQIVTMSPWDGKEGKEEDEPSDREEVEGKEGGRGPHLRLLMRGADGGGRLQSAKWGLFVLSYFVVLLSGMRRRPAMTAGSCRGR